MNNHKDDIQATEAKNKEAIGELKAKYEAQLAQLGKLENI